MDQPCCISRRNTFCRYYLYGDVSKKAAEELAKPDVLEFFVRLIQRVAPKAAVQAAGEVNTVRKWLESFSGDSVSVLHNLQSSRA